jgi:hypothetical protein
MFDGQYNKYASDEQFYQDMMSWMEMERELSEQDISEMEREQVNRSLTVQNLIVSKSPVNNQDYDNSKAGA